MNPRLKLVIVCGPELGHDQATFYSRDQGFLGMHTERFAEFYFFPEADLGYRAYRDHVSDMIAKVMEQGKEDHFVLIHTRYLEPAINGFVELAYESNHKERKKIVDHDQVEVHLFRRNDDEDRWTIHTLNPELHLTNEWSVGIFY